MSIIKYIPAFIFGILLASLFFYFTADKKNILQSMQAIGSLGIMSSAFIALAAYASNQKSKKQDELIARSKINLDLALDFLKHAYETLTNNNPNEVPINDRVLWLTCARQLLASKKISDDIEHGEHKYVYKEYEDYWRTKLYSFLEKHKEELNKRYFAEKAEHAIVTPTDARQPLHEKSLAVIFRFIEWDKDREDKVLNIDDFSKEEIKRHQLFGFEGLADHLLEFRNHKKSAPNNQA